MSVNSLQIAEVAQLSDELLAGEHTIVESLDLPDPFGPANLLAPGYSNAVAPLIRRVIEAEKAVSEPMPGVAEPIDVFFLDTHVELLAAKTALRERVIPANCWELTTQMYLRSENPHHPPFEALLERSALEGQVQVGDVTYIFSPENVTYGLTLVVNKIALVEFACSTAIETVTSTVYNYGMTNKQWEESLPFFEPKSTPVMNMLSYLMLFAYEPQPPPTGPTTIP